MDGFTKPNPLFSSIFLSLFFLAFSTISSTPHQYHTFFPDFGSEDVLTLPLHHVDRLHPTKSVQELLRQRLDRDVRRVQALSAHHGSISLNSSVYSGLPMGEFFTRVAVGNPPQLVQLVVDTGSDLTWLQCSPCDDCYHQTGPLFDPAQSKSFQLITCGSLRCSFLKTQVCGHNKTCLYHVGYEDKSFTEGELATETLTFRTRRLAQVIIGCSSRTEGIFAGANGILGLGQGNVSFPVRKGYLFNRTFSYCLVDLLSSNDSSWLMFGEAAISRKAMFTPMVINEPGSTFYMVHLTEISVGGESVSLPEAMDVMVDSGTTVSRLEQRVYDAVRDTFLAGNKELKPVDSPIPDVLDTCFDLSGMEDVNVTTVEFGFHGGVRMVLASRNLLIKWDDEGTYCLAIAGTIDGVSILGNVQQQGFRFVFDLRGKRVGIAPDNCKVVPN